MGTSAALKTTVSSAISGANSAVSRELTALSLWRERRATEVETHSSTAVKSTKKAAAKKK